MVRMIRSATAPRKGGRQRYGIGAPFRPYVY
jgi:hypothetical protein